MNVAIMGYGTIGSGVAEVLKKNADLIEKRAGEKLEVKKVLDLRDFEGDPVAPLIVHDYKEISEDEDIKLVVETMGGVEPAFTFVKAMLEAGKHVTTSNKALIADKGAELIKIAKDNNVSFLFEASVGGGIPIIRTILEALTGDEIEEIAGIVNGTTNYMLTKMTREGSDFDEVLKEAQAHGYAEADPTADIEGDDACRKIAILTSIVEQAQVDYKDIPTEGITSITPADIRYAKAMGREVKLLAMSRRVGDTYSVRVAPFLLKNDHPLYSVHDVFNAVYVVGNALGPSMYYGSGAGSLPTASAVVGDVVEMALRIANPVHIPWSSEKVSLYDEKKQEFAHFVRFSCDASKVEEVMPIVKVVDGVVDGEIGVITPVMTEQMFEDYIAQFNEGQFISQIRLAER